MYSDCRVLDLAAVKRSFTQPPVCSCASVTTLGGASSRLRPLRFVTGRNAASPSAHNRSLSSHMALQA